MLSLIIRDRQVLQIHFSAERSRKVFLCISKMTLTPSSITKSLKLVKLVRHQMRPTSFLPLLTYIAAANWPYNGKRYMLAYPPVPHQQTPSSTHNQPSVPPPMQPPPYEEDSAAQAAPRPGGGGYVFAYPTYGYPQVSMTEKLVLSMSLLINLIAYHARDAAPGTPWCIHARAIYATHGISSQYASSWST
jgi:hypothetical protein